MGCWGDQWDNGWAANQSNINKIEKILYEYLGRMAQAVYLRTYVYLNDITDLSTYKAAVICVPPVCRTYKQRGPVCPSSNLSAALTISHYNLYHKL